MKTAFTLIELIFAIVIMGILAVVAIPRLNATRDDAQASTAAANISVAVMDITSYYTAKGFFTDVKSMSNIVVDDNGNVKVKNTDCFRITVSNATSSEVDPTKGISVGSPILKVVAISSSDNACLSAQILTRSILDSSPINIGQGNVKFN